MLMCKRLLTLVLALPLAFAAIAAGPTEKDEIIKKNVLGYLNGIIELLDEAAKTISDAIPDFHPDRFDEFNELKAYVYETKAATEAAYEEGTLAEYTGGDFTTILTAKLELAKKIQESAPKYVEYYNNLMASVFEIEKRLVELERKLVEEYPAFKAEESWDYAYLHDLFRNFAQKVQIMQMYDPFFRLIDYYESGEFRDNYNELLAGMDYIEQMAYEAQHAERERANKEAFDNDLILLDDLKKKASDTHNQMLIEYPNVDPDQKTSHALDEINNAIRAAKDEYARATEEKDYYKSPFQVDDLESLIQAIIDYCVQAGITSVETSASAVEYYTPAGVRLDKPVRGALNIVRYSDGSVRKTIVK